MAVGVAGRVRHPPGGKWSAEEQRPRTREQAPPPPPPPPAAQGAPDYAAELERLAKLRDQGVINADDFEAKKKQLLGI